MIRLLDHKEESTAEKMLAVQIPAYKIEAEWIGFDGIPQLRDTIHDIIISEEVFIGNYEGTQLAGFVSFTKTDELLDICRLVVHPYYFRKGIATALLKHVLSLKLENQQVLVSTGAKNTPAIQLYENFGFKKSKDIEVEPNFFITQLIYR
ncbi:GNAT family N-acetyltransferase [Psychrobacillus vulpis]|uniref:GNAT family N-acetyltransferase n=1 Tax=Psychrobacillus vulpis TaxID=2325572 RepID=A0A544TNF3_9BACI|nr:GNAT family N-acetyltransferase [Psychrobacillus vulpis]TQR18970.1 GNAT family N-acetyltransferase [Psychrobacillus vulpis]